MAKSTKKEFATYNKDTNAHEIEIGKEMETVSIRFNNGERRITLCFVPFTSCGKSDGGTIDIQRHDDDLVAERNDQHSDNTDREMTQHWPLIAFCTKKDDKGRVKMGTADVRCDNALLPIPYNK